METAKQYDIGNHEHFQSGKQLPHAHNKEECQNSTTKTVSCTSKQNQTSSLQEKFDRYTTMYFLNVPIPLKQIEDEHFNKIFAALNIDRLGLTIMNESSLKLYIHNLYLKIRNHIKNQLMTSHHVCLTTKNFFLGYNHSKYIITKCYWINDDLKRTGYVISCRKFYGYQRADMIGTEEFDYLAGLRDLRELVEINNGLIEEKMELHIASDIIVAEHYMGINKICLFTCPVVQLHIYYNTCKRITGLDTILKKCQELWDAVKKSTFVDAAENILGRQLDVPASSYIWDTYQPLKDLLSIRDKIEQLYDALGLKYNLLNADFQLISDYIIGFRHIVDVIRVLRQDKDQFNGLVLPCLLILRKKLLRSSNENDAHIKCKHFTSKFILKDLECMFCQYFYPFLDIGMNVAIAAISYPRFKDEWFNCVDAKFQSKIKDAFVQAIAEEITPAEMTATPMCNNTRAVTPECNINKTRIIPDSIINKSKISTKCNVTPKYNIENSDTTPKCNINELNITPNCNTTQNPTTDCNIEESFFEFDMGIKTPRIDNQDPAILMRSYLADEDQDVTMLHRHEVVKKVFVKYNTAVATSDVWFLTSLSDSLLDFKDVINEDLFSEFSTIKCNINMLNEL